MADHTHDKLKVVGRHVPEDVTDARAAGYDVDNPVTGMYEVGVEVEGAFLPLVSYKASDVFERIDRAKAEKDKTGPTADTQDEEQQ